MTSETPPGYAATRDVLRRIGAHVLSRARHAAVGRIDMAPTPGGIGTPAFGADHRVIRIGGGSLIVESTGEPASTRAVPIDGSTLRELADFVGADLTTALDVGGDTPPQGDVDEPISLDTGSIVLIGSWFAYGVQVVDAVLAGLQHDASPSRARIWPEHLDLGIDIAATEGAEGMRLNLGASPGDDFHETPYLYVAPWGSDRPGDAAYWNAPFGATFAVEGLRPPGSDDVASGAAFMLEGIARFG